MLWSYLIFEIAIHYVSCTRITVNLTLKTTVLPVIRTSIGKVKTWRKIPNWACGCGVTLLISVWSCSHWAINSILEVKYSAYSCHVRIQVRNYIVVNWGPRRPHCCCNALESVWLGCESDIGTRHTLDWNKRSKRSGLKPVKVIIRNSVSGRCHWWTTVNNSTFASCTDAWECWWVKIHSLLICAHVDETSVGACVAGRDWTAAKDLDLSNACSS